MKRVAGARLIIRAQQVADGVVPVFVKLLCVSRDRCDLSAGDAEFRRLVVDEAFGGVIAALRPFEDSSAVPERLDVVDATESLHLFDWFAVDIERYSVGNGGAGASWAVLVPE